MRNIFIDEEVARQRVTNNALCMQASRGDCPAHRQTIHEGYVPVYEVDTAPLHLDPCRNDPTKSAGHFNHCKINRTTFAVVRS